MNFTKQQQKVYDYIKKHPGCTTFDIRRDTFVSCPTGRMSEMRGLGIVFLEVGDVSYPGSKPFKKYALPEPRPAPLPAAKQLAMV